MENTSRVTLNGKPYASRNMDWTFSCPFSPVTMIPEPLFRFVFPTTCGDHIRCYNSYIFMIDLLFHIPAIWRVSVLGEMALLRGWFIMWLYHKWCRGNQLTVRKADRTWGHLLHLDFFIVFFMLHNPCVYPCTQYHRSIHLCDLIPRYTKSSYPKTQHYQPAQLDLGRSISTVDL